MNWQPDSKYLCQIKGTHIGASELTLFESYGIVRNMRKISEMKNPKTRNLEKPGQSGRPEIEHISKMASIIYNVEASITKLTFYHIRCFLLSKDAFTPNLAEFGPVTRAHATNLALNQSRIEILRVCKKLDRF